MSIKFSTMYVNIWGRATYSGNNYRAETEIKDDDGAVVSLVSNAMKWHEYV
jgi:hypothetical protein